METHKEAQQIFLGELTGYYTRHGRHDMLWRQPETDGSFDPYKILVSELMLQQTQVPRVTLKYIAFLHRFPSVQALSEASLGDVLGLWSGLGYNRRAKYLWQAARMVAQDFRGTFPRTMPELRRLPGVGPNTAGAIMAYAFNRPVVFVETNIRTVIIHHFFKDKTGISDTAIREILAQILQHLNDTATLEPREFYWALMDYGAHLKKSVGNLNSASKHYVKQPAFQGSRRQLRGKVLKLLTVRTYDTSELIDVLRDKRAEAVIQNLQAEGMITQANGVYELS